MTTTGDAVLLHANVDGEDHAAEVEARLLLADFLRGPCGVAAVHVGCGEGTCGACTVSVDGVPVRSCLMFAVQADGTTIVTAAGLAAIDGPRDENGLTPLQAAFRAHHALQCGFCTPGLLVATALFLRDTPGPDRDAILDHLSGHLCRCTGYRPIVAAIEAAAGRG